MQGAGMVAGALGACAKWERRALAVELFLVGQSGFVVTLHVIPLNITLAESLWMATALVRTRGTSDSANQ